MAPVYAFLVKVMEKVREDAEGSESAFRRR